MGKFIERFLKPKKAEKEPFKKEEPPTEPAQEEGLGAEIKEKEKKIAPQEKEQAKIEAEKIVDKKTAEPEKPKATPEQLERVSSERENSRKQFMEREIKRDHYAGDIVKGLAKVSKMPLEEIDKRKTNIEGMRDLINKRGEEIGSLLNFLSKDSDEMLKKIFKGNLEKLQKVGAFSPHEFVRESPQVKNEAPPVEQENRMIGQILIERGITADIIEPEGAEQKKFTEQEKEENLRKIFSKTPLAQEHARFRRDDES